MGGCGHSFIRCDTALWRDTHRRNHSLLRRSVLHLFIKEQKARVIVSDILTALKVPAPTKRSRGRVTAPLMTRRDSLYPSGFGAKNLNKLAVDILIKSDSLFAVNESKTFGGGTRISNSVSLSCSSLKCHTTYLTRFKSWLTILGAKLYCKDF